MLLRAHRFSFSGYGGNLQPWVSRLNSRQTSRRFLSLDKFPVGFEFFRSSMQCKVSSGLQVSFAAVSCDLGLIGFEVTENH